MPRLTLRRWALWAGLLSSGEGAAACTEPVEPLSDVPMDQRLVAAAAEGLDFLVPSDHDVIARWDDVVAELGLGRPSVVTGLEITPDRWVTPLAVGHFNLFPVTPDLDPASFVVNGAPGAVVERLVELAPRPSIVQLNHPRLNDWIGYSWVVGLDPATATADVVSRFWIPRRRARRDAGGRRRPSERSRRGAGRREGRRHATCGYPGRHDPCSLPSGTRG